MKSFHTSALALLAALLLATPALANDAIRKAVKDQLSIEPDTITKTPYGFYEVYAQGRIFYTDEAGTAFLFGTLVDAKTSQNVTGKRLYTLLPLDLAVKQVKGNGKATLVTFEDPNCGYCQRLARDVAKLKDVTVYTFLFPILSDDSVEKTHAVWCSADRAKAWNDMMVFGTAPVGKKDCTAPIEKFVALGQRYNVTGTPTLFFTDGSRVPGAIPLAQIEQRLTESSKAK
jgi:thiol:disulfide interchange protein DsbC